MKHVVRAALTAAIATVLLAPAPGLGADRIVLLEKFTATW
jgi:hypothetical protein